MAQQVDIDNLVTAFNESFLAAFFPNIDTPEGQQLLEAIAEYVIDCYQFVLDNCPNIWFAFATHTIAVILSNWGITIGDSEIIIETPQGSSGIETFLKSRKIGEKTCTFEQIKEGTTFEDKPADSWKKKATELYEKCRLAHKPMFFGGGSNWPECYDACGCDTKISSSSCDIRNRRSGY